MSSDKKKPAFISAGLTVIVLALASILVASTYVLLVSQTSSIRSTNAEKIAIVVSESCAEIAINELLLDNTYAAGQNYNIGIYTCSVDSITGTGNTNRIITTSSTIDNITINTQVTIDTLSPDVIIGEWIQI